MTLQGLLLLILLGIFVQLVVYDGVAFVRHWLAYQALKEQGGSLTPAEPAESPVEGAEHPPAWHDYRAFKVVRRQYEDPAGNICSFHLAPVDGQTLPAFQPGQFLTFRLDKVAGKSLIRCYSLSDRPDPAQYRISVKRVPAASPELPPGLASNHFHDRVREGDLLSVKAPGGHFHLDPAGEGAVVLVAGGIGITPVFSMLKATLAARPAREVWLFYGVRDGSEMAMRAELEQLAAAHPSFNLHVCFSRPGPNDVAGRDYRHAGRADIDRLRMELKLKPYHFYVCGPGPMMETLVPALEDWGVPTARIHYEAFGPATVTRRGQAAEAATGIGVTFARSGRRLDWTAGSASLLELAESNGIKLDSGCRAGCCGACQTSIESGEVAYEQLPEFDVEPGKCLMCIAKPQTDLVLSA